MQEHSVLKGTLSDRTHISVSQQSRLRPQKQILQVYTTQYSISSTSRVVIPLSQTSRCARKSSWPALRYCRGCNPQTWCDDIDHQVKVLWTELADLQTNHHLPHTYTHTAYPQSVYKRLTFSHQYWWNSGRGCFRRSATPHPKWRGGGYLAP